MSSEPTTPAARYERLSLLHRAAVRIGWHGWTSPSSDLMAVWAHVPELDARPEKITEIDWCRLEDAARTTAERRARWVWHDIASEVVRMVPAGAAQRRCAVEATDALNIITEEDACLAAAAACRSAIRIAGAPAARRAAAMAYSACRPDPSIMTGCLGDVPSVEIDGRVYVV